MWNTRSSLFPRMIEVCGQLRPARRTIQYLWTALREGHSLKRTGRPLAPVDRTGQQRPKRLAKHASCLLSAWPCVCDVVKMPILVSRVAKHSQHTVLDRKAPPKPTFWQSIPGDFRC